MKIFSGTANRALAERIAAYLGVQLGDLRIERFPDGEIFVKIAENIRGHDVFIIQPTCRPPNETLMELLIIIDAMKRASAKRITAVMPFYGYGRQDRKDQPRVPITAKLVANLLVAAGVTRLLAMDFHAQQIQGFFDIPVDHLFAAPVIVKYLRKKQLNNPIIVSPDPGGLKMAYGYSQTLNSELAIVAKQRKNASEVTSYNLVGCVEGRDAILVDDLISTGGTLHAAAKLLKEHRAKKIIAAATHGVFAPLFFERFKEPLIEEFIITDTLPMRQMPDDFPVTILSVADLLGEAIKCIHDNQSVTSLFRT